MIKNEKTKLKINQDIYNIAAKNFGCHPLETILKYDGDTPEMIFQKIKKKK